MVADFNGVLESIRNGHPLIHNITSPVAINDCANLVLAVGAQPIMAEHPDETAEITRSAKALTVSLANVTDARMASALISGKAALESGIPAVIDAVGVTCSPLRRRLAEKFISECRPAVIKGNYSEIRALAGAAFDPSQGVDSLDDQAFSAEAMAKLVKRFALETSSVVFATGALDLVSDGTMTLGIANGVPEMARVTGTGCMLTCLTGCFLTAADPLSAAAMSAACFGICGELALLRAGSKGLGSFHIALLDELSLLDAEIVSERQKIRRL